VEQLSDLLLAIYRAARDLPLTEFQDAVFNSIKPVLKFDSRTWGTGTLTPRGLVFDSVQRQEEHPDRVRQEVMDQGTTPSIAKATPESIPNTPPPTFHSGYDKADTSHHARPCGHRNCLVTVIGRTDPETQLVRWVALHRADPEAYLSGQECKLCQQLAPHLVEALTLNWVLNAARMRAVGGGPLHYMAIADRYGDLYFAERGFSDLIRSEWPDWMEGLLPRPLCEAILDTPAEKYIGKHLVIRRSDVKDLVFLTARAKLPPDRLTARELAVARHVADGLTYKEIARLLNISPATVRNHIQAIHARLQVHNNAELALQLKQAGL